jgi:hypothetical protein
MSAAWGSEKKGVGLAEPYAGGRIEQLNVTWYYTWKPYPLAGAPLEKFVPMVSGERGGRLFEEHLAYQKTQGRVPYLLVFNVPNKEQHANKSVAEVIALWPQVEGLADNLSTPAPSNPTRRWFVRFFEKAKELGLKMDFMAVHFYTPPDPELFLNQVDATYRKYRMPIWITEFAVADWAAMDRPGTNRYSEQQVLEFMSAVLPELEKRPYVVRYAWFGAGDYWLKHEEVRTSRLFEKDGVLTKLGRFYADFSWPPPSTEQ